MRVKNVEPKFNKPSKAQLKGTSRLHRKLNNLVWAENFKPELWPEWRILLPDRQRRFNKDRVKALVSIFRFIAWHIDIYTLTLNLSCFATIAEETGLITQSKAGNKSITRCWRAFSEVLIKAGLAESEKMPFDSILKENLPAFITITPLFFELCGIKQEELFAEHERRAIYKGIVDPALLGYAGIRKLQNEVKRQHIAKNFERLKARKANAYEKRKAKKALESKHAEQLSLIGAQIIKEFESEGQLALLTPRTLREESLKRQGLYKKIYDS